MVKRSKKSKSKRISLKKKHKIIKKVKEHHRKKAKEAKKLGLNHKRKVEKDPGIPNDWPFKEQELKALEARRARALEELEQKKVARKERAQKRKMGLLENDDTAKLASAASAKDHEFENRYIEAKDSGVTKSHDHSERAFYRELVKVIEASDVILEVLDARDPLGTRCLDMEKLIFKADPNKRLVLLLNKIDLVPREAVEKWLSYLRGELPTVAFKCNTQEQKSNLGWKSSSKGAKPSNILQTSDCLGAETLLKLLKNYSRSCEIKVSITVGIVGLPNVGKSSLINSLKRSHVVNVGATPGLTRSMQEVQLDKKVKLLDCPGVVMLKSGESDASIALRNCKRIEKLDDPVRPVKEILKLCPAEMLMSLYKLPSFSSVDDFLQKVATIRGKLKKGGIVDIEAAARIVLHDWNEGKIHYYTLPPTRDGVDLETKIVSEFGKEFDVDEVYKSESVFIDSLASVEEFRHVEVPPGAPPSFDEQMLEELVKDKVKRIRRRHAIAKRYQKRALKTSAWRVSFAAAKSGSLFIPLEVIADILFRLPVKSLARFRCVSKQWNSLTYDSDFVKKQHMRALETGRSMLLGTRALETGRSMLVGGKFIISLGVPLYNYGPDGQIKDSSFYINFTDEDGKPLHTSYTLSNPINGLVGASCWLNGDPSYYLLNPVTRDFLRLPRGGHRVLCDSMRCLGLGFDDSTGEYKLVRLYQKYPKKHQNYVSCSCEVLTVGTEGWRYVGDAPCYFLFSSSVFLNGALHWMAYSSSSSNIIVLAFDIKEEKFRYVSIPRITNRVSAHYYTAYSMVLFLRELEGHLCIVKPSLKRPLKRPGESISYGEVDRFWMFKDHANKQYDSTVIRIWMLKDYGNDQEWEEKYNFDASGWENQTGAQFSHFVDIKEGKVLMQDCQQRFYRYDLHKGTLDKLYDKASYGARVITESLISPRSLLINNLYSSRCW